MIESSTAGLRISCTSANASGAGSSEELIRYFSERLPDAAVYRKQPPAGVVMAGAFDWYFLLAAGADIATILDTIYGAYQVFVKPLRSAGKEDAGFYVRIENQFGSSVQGMLGPQGDSKDIFVKETERHVREIIEEHERRITRVLVFRESEIEIKAIDRTDE